MDRLRVLVGGIGYRNLRDGSVGIHVIERLAGRAADGVEVEDVSYHPVGLSQNLQDRPPYDRVVLVAAIATGPRARHRHCLPLGWPTPR